MSIYEEFLRLLDFSDEEIAVQLPLWENACHLLGLSEEDVRFATEDWIPQYWDLSLRGVRKCIGAYFRELIEMTRLSEYKANGAKILYCNMPSHPACIYANKISGGNNIHISHPDFLIASVLNAFFHKTTISDANEHSCMNPLCYHCGMNRLKADAQCQGVIISPDVMWNWGLFCNEAPKTEELIQGMGRDDWHYVLTMLPHDVPMGVHEAADDSRITYLATQLRDSQERVSELTGIPVTDEHVILASEEYIHYVSKLEELSDLVLNSDPQPISGNDLALFGAMTHSAFDTGFSYVNEAIDVTLEEVRKRVNQKQGPLPAGAPRLACHFHPYCVPWVNKAFMENGVNLTISILFAPASVLKQFADQGDVYKSIAQQWLSNPSAVNMADEANMVAEMLETCRVDGVLYGFFAFDRWMGPLQKTMIKIVEEKTGIPHFYLEGDFWNDARYSLEDRIDQIQSIAHKLKIHHMVSGWNYVKKSGITK